MSKTKDIIILLVIALILLPALVELALRDPGNLMNEPLPAQRWFVTVQGSSEVQDVYIADKTEETVELVFEDDTYTRFVTEDVKFIELVPKQQWIGK